MMRSRRLASGADAASQDGDGETALHKASAQGHAEVVTLLLAACPAAALLTDKRGQRAVDAASSDAIRAALGAGH